jgi:predicted dehydrogenase
MPPSPPLKLGLVGFGKIARDQHLPAIAATAGAQLVAVASRHARAPGLAHYLDVEALLQGEPGLDAVIMCQPPQARYAAARAALLAGKHVFLEKPPGATVSEVEALAALARAKRLTLYASWHSRQAAGVAPARAWLQGRRLQRAAITWKEDVRHWHPGQSWIFEAGGFGVFDPGINALSVLTEVVGERIRVVRAELEIPANRAAPIAATLALETLEGAPIEVALDFRQTGVQTWDVELEAEHGRLRLSQGGARVAIDGADQTPPSPGEYPALYRRFVELARRGESEVDLAPLALAADAFLCGRWRPTEPFED